jgi:DNA-binding transcriptional ArsR family regulator
MSLQMTFSALADPNRRALLERLEAGEQTLSDLASPLPISLMAIQKHVHFLEKAKLVTTSKIGRSRYVRLRIDGLRYAADWMQNAEARWNAALDKLEEVLEEEKKKQK